MAGMWMLCGRAARRPSTRGGLAAAARRPGEATRRGVPHAPALRVSSRRSTCAALPQSPAHAPPAARSRASEALTPACRYPRPLQRARGKVSTHCPRLSQHLCPVGVFLCPLGSLLASCCSSYHLLTLTQPPTLYGRSPCRQRDSGETSGEGGAGVRGCSERNFQTARRRRHKLRGQYAKRCPRAAVPAYSRSAPASLLLHVYPAYRVSRAQIVTCL